MRGGNNTGIQTIREVIIQYLKTQKQPISQKELEDIVKSKRPDLISKNLGATIRSVLYRATELSKSGTGMVYLDKK